MIAGIAPSAMIFLPSLGGTSHNPREHTPDADQVDDANNLLDVVAHLTEELSAHHRIVPPPQPRAAPSAR